MDIWDSVELREHQCIVWSIQDPQNHWVEWCGLSHVNGDYDPRLAIVSTPLIHESLGYLLCLYFRLEHDMSMYPSSLSVIVECESM